MADVVETAGADEPAGWDEFVASQPGAHGYHEWAWQGIIARSFGHRGVPLIAKSDGSISGVLPLIEMRSPLFGHFLTSMPFLNYGGVLAASPSAARGLVEAAAELGRSRGCKHVELRHVGRCCPELPVRQHKVTMHLPLADGMWERLDRKVRNQVRKAEKSGLTAERGDARFLPEFYAVFSRNMRDLGTPVYGRRFFEEVAEAFGERVRFVVVRQGKEAIAGALTYRTRSVTEVPWASSIREFNALCPNHLMYWRAIEWALEDGCGLFDFGRSTPGEGTYKFKSQWGAEPVPLHWEYPYLDGGHVPDHGPTNPKFQHAIALWQRLPLWVTRAVGPHIAKAIP